MGALHISTTLSGTQCSGVPTPAQDTPGILCTHHSNPAHWLGKHQAWKAWSTYTMLNADPHTLGQGPCGRACMQPECLHNGYPGHLGSGYTQPCTPPPGSQEAPPPDLRPQECSFGRWVGSPGRQGSGELPEPRGFMCQLRELPPQGWAAPPGLCAEPGWANLGPELARRAPPSTMPGRSGLPRSTQPFTLTAPTLGFHQSRQVWGHNSSPLPRVLVTALFLLQLTQAIKNPEGPAQTRWKDGGRWLLLFGHTGPDPFWVSQD